MKKFLVLVLALTMALSLAAPALAFTEVEYDADDAAAALAIKLVDVSAGFVNINFTAPPSNRGYLKNEVVCAVVSLFVPKDYDLVDSGYTTMVFTGDNVSVWQDDNFYAAGGSLTGAGRGMLQYMSSNAQSTIAANAGAGGGLFEYDDPMAVENNFFLDLTSNATPANFATNPFINGSKDQTYHFAFFGKVVADDAKMVAKLVGTGEIYNAQTDGKFNVISLKDDYDVGYYHEPDLLATKPAAATTLSTDIAAVADVADNNLIDFDSSGNGYLYYVELPNLKGAIPAGELFAVVTDKNFNCTAMWVYLDTTVAKNSTPGWYRVNVLNGTNAKNQPGAIYADFWGCYVQFETVATGAWTVLTDPGDMAYLKNFLCEDIIWDVWGLNPALKGQMKPAWWAKNKELVAEVTVEPWYAEVTVPTEIELEAPKTGDVVSALGFVLVALAGLAFVAVRKVKA